MKIFARIIIVITVFLIGFYYGQLKSKELIQNNDLSNNQAQEEQRDSEETKKTASLMIDFQNGELKIFNDLELTENTSVFDLLKSALEEGGVDFVYKDYGGELGALVESINGVENNMKDGKYWQYWLNNEYAKVGASVQKIKNGDIIEWKFIKGQF